MDQMYAENMEKMSQNIWSKLFVWGGSPATEQIDAGIETVELEDDQSTVKDNTATITTTSNSSSSESTQADSEVQAGYC